MLYVSAEPLPGTAKMPSELGEEQLDLPQSLTLAGEVFSNRELRDREV
jgi:hypothetical protein